MEPQRQQAQHNFRHRALRWRKPGRAAGRFHHRDKFPVQGQVFGRGNALSGGSGVDIGDYILVNNDGFVGDL